MMMSRGDLVRKRESTREDRMLTIYSSHDEADLRRVGGAGEMCVDLLGLLLVERDESVQYVIAGCVVVRTTWEAPLACMLDSWV